MAIIDPAVWEAERLSELKSFDILDSITENDYEEITKLASVICDVPIALISFVDKDRQWFKSHLGLQAQETLREYSFCAHAIQNINEPFIIEDSRLDNRVKDNPLVTGDPRIVFYAGIPLVSENGYGLGTVCVIDTRPRVLSHQQLSALKILSDQVIRLLQLRKKNAQLQEFIEKQIVQRTSDIAAQNMALEKMNKELQAFNYVSSHDLQEPLRKIQTFVSLLTEREKENLSSSGQDYLERISKSSRRMRLLLNDLISYSRLAFAEKKYTQVSLQSVVDGVKIELEKEITEKRAAITVAANCSINIIGGQFQLLLHHLLNNSLRFSKSNVNPVIQISGAIIDPAKGNGDSLDPLKQYYHFRVSDNGVGFDNKYNEKVFEIFQRLTTAHPELGTGIGLAIVQKIVDNHQGVIKASSVENLGTTFDIYIPLIV